jgi:hypothetical protein
VLKSGRPQMVVLITPFGCYSLGRPLHGHQRLRSSAATVWRVASEPDEPIPESSRLTSSNMDLTFAIFSL